MSLQWLRSGSVLWCRFSPWPRRLPHAEGAAKKKKKTKKKIISLYTDSRECSHTFLDAKNEKLKEFAESQYAYLNLLLVGCLKRYGVMCRTVEEVIAELGKALEAYYE